MLETLLKATDDVERCGLILSDGSLLEITNVAEDPAVAYEMKSSEVFPYLDQVVGTWHTHPNADPGLSGEDYKGFLAWPDWSHSIIGVRDGKNFVCKYVVEDGIIVECD